MDTHITGSLDLGGVFNANSTSNFTGDALFSGGAAAVNINANSDIRFGNGTWTGEACKIQQHANALYIQGGSNGHNFRRSNGTTAVYITSGGNFVAENAVTIAGLLDANGGAHIDNLRLGVDADNDITTSSGNLTLDSANGNVVVNDNLSVDGTITGNGSGLTTLNADRLTDGTVPLARLGDSGDKNGTTFLAGDNTFKTVVVAINTLNGTEGNNRIITSAGGNSAICEAQLTFDGVTFSVQGTGSHAGKFVNAANGDLSATGDLTAFTSDIRLKTDIQGVTNYLEGRA